MSRLDHRCRATHSSAESAEGLLEEALGHDRWLYHLPRPARVPYRQPWLVALSSGKRVIHLGFADTCCEDHRRTTSTWLHARLVGAAEHVVGLDADGSAVARAAAQGLDVLEVDCTDTAAVRLLGVEPADVVVVGELIEHVHDPIALLASAGALVRPRGEIVVTTPNANDIHSAILAAAQREIVHPDHLMTFSPRHLIAVACRSGLRPRELLTYRADVEPAPVRTPRGPRQRQPGPWQRRAMHKTAQAVSRLLAWPFPYLDPGLIVRCSGPPSS